VSALLAGAHAHGIAHLVRSSVRRRDAAQVDVDITGALLAEGEQECFGITLQIREPKTDAGSALTHELDVLDDCVGQLPLSELTARATRLFEQRFMMAAMARTHGDADAAAGLLGIAVEQLLQCLQQAAAAPETPPLPSA